MAQGTRHDFGRAIVTPRQRERTKEIFATDTAAPTRRDAIGPRRWETVAGASATTTHTPLGQDTLGPRRRGMDVAAIRRDTIGPRW